MEQPVITGQPVPPNQTESESEQLFATRVQMDDDAKSYEVDQCCCLCEEPQRADDCWERCWSWYTMCYLCRCAGQLFEMMGQCLEWCLVGCAEGVCGEDCCTGCCPDSCCDGCCDN